MENWDSESLDICWWEHGEGNDFFELEKGNLDLWASSQIILAENQISHHKRGADIKNNGVSSRLIRYALNHDIPGAGSACTLSGALFYVYNDANFCMLIKMIEFAHYFPIFLELEQLTETELRVKIYSQESSELEKMFSTIILMKKLQNDQNLSDLDQLTIQLTRVARQNRIYKEELEKLKKQ